MNRDSALEQYRLHRLAKVLFVISLVLTFSLSWWLAFAPVHSMTAWSIAYPESPEFTRANSDHFAIGDEIKWSCPAAYQGAHHCGFHYISETNTWWPSDDGTGALMTERFKIYALKPISNLESVAYAAIFTIVVGFILWVFYTRVVLYVALGARKKEN